MVKFDIIFEVTAVKKMRRVLIFLLEDAIIKTMKLK